MWVAMLWTKFEYMESYPFIFDVDYMEGMKLAYFCIFEDVECTSSQIQASFVSSFISSLYEWSFVLGFTDSNSIHSFIESTHM